MKKIWRQGLFTIIIAICMSCTLLIGPAAAADEIYVNPGGDSIGSGLEGVYVIGGDGNAAPLDLSGAWAITASGLEQIGASGTVTPAVPVTPPTGTISVKTSVIKVGLDYYYSSARNSSVASATLTNYVGSGYIFGYYDANRNFFEVGRTAETKLTMVKDTNVTVSAGTVGCYHVKLPGSYSSFDAAAAAASAYTGGFPAYYDGAYYALAGHYKSVDDAQAAVASGIPGEAFSASNRCVVVTKTGTTQILFEFDCGSSYALAVRPIANGGKAETTYNGNFRYYGDFQFIRTTGENMTVVNILPLEDYVKGVVPYEMSASWPLEALKAQALCARTYVMSNINAYSSYGFDVTDDTYCQAYCGTRSANSTTDRAVEETAGLYITYGGRLCEALYFSSDGGATEDSENVFASAIPYLRGVIDPYEDAIDFPNKTWSAQLTASQITSRLQAKGYTISTIASVKPEYTTIGNMGKLTFTDVNGKSVTVTKTGCYSVLGLKSVHFTMEESQSSPGTYLIEGGGWGHNVGMSQWGANAMASVYGYSYAQIIGFYYTGVTIARGITA